MGTYAERPKTLAAGESGGDCGGCGERGPSTHGQDAGPGEAIQRTPVDVCTINHQRGARSVVLARTPEDSERQELYAITGLERTLGVLYWVGGDGSTRELYYNS
ncbi:unnamed protein product, partial [Laminaria digitata]